jgi:Zn-finger nucleic acid-binding protein
MICKHCGLKMGRGKNEQGKYSKCPRCKTMVLDKPGQGVGDVNIKIGNIFQNQGIKIGGN